MPKIIVKDHKYYFKIRGLGGPKGDKGDTGPAGPQGPQGPYVNVVAGTTTTLPAGSSAQVTVNNTGNTSVLNFGVPQGAKGDKGDAGTPGAQGPRGFAATVNVGETTTGQPGTNASVINAGNEHDAVLKFTIPRGEKGETGETGPQGPTGGVKSTVVAELPETGESDKYYLVYRDSEGGTITTTDGRAQIENDENAGDLTASQLLGNAEQTTYSGKNLFHFPLNISTSLYGVAITASANASTFVLNGTSTATSAEVSQAMIGTSNPLKLKAGTYTCKITGLKQYTTQAERVYLAPTSAVGTPFVELKPNNGWTVTFTLASDTDAVMYLILSNQSSHSNTEVALQIESGSTATDYEPYVGGTASPNPDYPQPISTVTGAQNIKVSGKNLFDMDDFLTAAEATYTKNGGQYSITAWGNLISIRYPLQSVKTGNTYTISLDGVAQNTANTRLQVYKNGSAVGTIYGGTDHQEHSYTFTADGSQYELNATYSSPFSSPVIFKNPQLELGSTATAYEPYQGQSYEVNLGKNLFSISQDTIITNAYLNNNTTLTFDNLNSVKFVATGTQGAQYLYRIISGLDSTKSYAFSFKAIKNVKGSTGLPYIRIVTSGSNDGSTWTGLGFSGNDNPIEGETYSFAKTLTGYSHYRFMIFNNVDTPVEIGETTTFFDMQLEEGAQTSFAPYFAPIELAKVGTYQDRIYKSNSKWYIEKQVGKVDLGTLTWAGTPLHSTTSITDIKYTSTNTELGAIMAEKYTPHIGSGMSLATGCIAVDTNAVRVNDTNTPSGPAYYALATPTTTEITDETLLSQLNFLASLYEGENNISLVGAGAQGEFTGDYVVYDKYNKHKVYIWSSDDDTWQIILQ